MCIVDNIKRGRLLWRGWRVHTIYHSLTIGIPCSACVVWPATRQSWQYVRGVGLELLVPALNFFIVEWLAYYFFIVEWLEFIVTCCDSHFVIVGIRISFLAPCVNMPLPSPRLVLHVFRCQERVSGITLGLLTLPLVIVQHVRCIIDNIKRGRLLWRGWRVHTIHHSLTIGIPCCACVVWPAMRVDFTKCEGSWFGVAGASVQILYCQMAGIFGYMSW